MTMHYDSLSSFGVPFWAHELAVELEHLYHIRPSALTAEAAAQLNAPCSPVCLSFAAKQNPLTQHFYLHDPELVRSGLTKQVVRVGDQNAVVALTGTSYGDTLAWRADIGEAYEKGGVGAVLSLLRKPAYGAEKLRGQLQIANDYLWMPVPAGAIDEQRFQLKYLQQLRFVTRRRLLTLQEVLHQEAIVLYGLFCKPSFADLNRRRLLLGRADMSAEHYAKLSNHWDKLEASGALTALKPWTKQIRAYIKHLTD